MKNDRKIIVALITGTLILGILSWFPKPDLQDYLRFLFTAVLCWFLYLGDNWARVIMATLSALGSVIAVAFLIDLSGSPGATALLAVMFAFYGFAAYILFTKWHVEEYFSGRKP
jgi:hypothetical protein